MKLKPVVISKENILKDYSALSEEYKEIIRILYTEIPQNQIFKIFKVEELIRTNGNNYLVPIKELKEKIGVYIFINKEYEPVYIGLAGKEDSTHSLRDRLQKQLNANLSNSTLAKNIRDIEGLLQSDSTILNIEQKEKLRELILRYTAYIIVIITGEREDNNAIKKAKDLEKVLIALLRPRYNK